jgi:hypothetical protein
LKADRSSKDVDITELPPLLRDQRKVDAEQLNLLAIFHFIAAVLAGFGLLLLGAHFLFFLTFMTVAPRQAKGPMPPEQFFIVFKFFYALFASMLIASGVVNVMSGFYLRAQTHRMFSIVAAAFDCLHFPLGTVLGVFTIVVLMRDSVQELYESHDR